jgi:fumarylacetoacetate (FAA) hydrolase family protein
VYDNEPPEIFFKATPIRTVGPGEAVGIREDSGWDVPEPELAVVLTGTAIVPEESFTHQAGDRIAIDVENVDVLRFDVVETVESMTHPPSLSRRSPTCLLTSPDAEGIRN